MERKEEGTETRGMGLRKLQEEDKGGRGDGEKVAEGEGEKIKDEGRQE